MQLAIGLIDLMKYHIRIDPSREPIHLHVYCQFISSMLLGKVVVSLLCIFTIWSISCISLTRMFMFNLLLYSRLCIKKIKQENLWSKSLILSIVFEEVCLLQNFGICICVSLVHVGLLAYVEEIEFFCSTCQSEYSIYQNVRGWGLDHPLLCFLTNNQAFLPFYNEK